MNLHLPKQSPARNQMKEDHSAVEQADEASATSATDRVLGTSGKQPCFDEYLLCILIAVMCISHMTFALFVSEQSLDNVFHGMINQTSPVSGIDDALPPENLAIEARTNISESQNYHSRSPLISSDTQNLDQQVHESAPANVLSLALFNSPPEREAVTESVPQSCSIRPSSLLTARF